MSTLPQPHHESIYAQPRYYDIAFDNRDLEVECGFLEYLSRNLGRGRLDSFLEVCCGPGYHMRRFAGRGVRTYGTSFSPEMVAYAEQKSLAGDPGAGDDVPGGSGAVSFILADPRDFSLPEAVDLAFSPCGSLQYLLRNDEVVAHLVSVAKNLGRGGLYVIEMEHPAAFFGYPRMHPRQWESEQDGVHVKARRGSGHEEINPITQIMDLEIILEISEGGVTRVVRDSAPVRVFTHQEMRALVKLSGVFDWVTTFGALAIPQPFDMSDGAEHMVPVLRCSM